MTINVKIVCLLSELQRLALVQGYKAAKQGIALEQLEQFDMLAEQPKRMTIYTEILNEFSQRVLDVNYPQQ